MILQRLHFLLRFMVAKKRHITAVIMGLGKSLLVRIRYGLPQYPCRGVWGDMCRCVVMCPDGETVLTDEMLVSPRSVCLTLLLLSESFCVGNGPQLRSLVLADKLWFSPLLR